MSELEFHGGEDSFMSNIPDDKQHIYLLASETTGCGVIIGVAHQPSLDHRVGLYATDQKDYGPFWREVDRLRRVL